MKQSFKIKKYNWSIVIYYTVNDEESKEIKLKESEKELKDLLLENASFKVEINPSNINKKGIDDVKFLLCANAGGKYMPLSSTASLGETSRINLAIKTIFNELKPKGTIIFDKSIFVYFLVI